MRLPVVAFAVAMTAAGCTSMPSPAPSTPGVASPASAAARPDIAALKKQVGDAERGFAKSMADRNFAAFNAHLSDEAVFFTTTTVLRGKAAVSEFWKRFYEKPEAPFSWEPEVVEVLDSGTLALTFGPVRDPSGKHFANFQSIWRLEAPGVWRVIFDKGAPVCADCPKP